MSGCGICCLSPSLSYSFFLDGYLFIIPEDLCKGQPSSSSTLSRLIYSLSIQAYSTQGQGSTYQSNTPLDQLNA